MKEIGESFKEKREEIGITLEEVSKDLGIKEVLLENLEEGNAKVFKDILEIKDTIESYSKYLGLDTEKIMDEYKVGAIVIGLPKNMNNSLGFAAERTKEFVKVLNNTYDIPVYEQDERLSSVTANNVLLQADISRKKRKSKVDTVAATVILQNYLDIRKGEKNGK